MADMVHCPSCGLPYEASAKICVRCGIDLRTGKPLQTRLGGIEPDEGDEDDGPVEYTAWEKFVLTVGAFVPGVFRPMVLIVSILATVVALGLGWYAWVLFSFGMGFFAPIALGGVALIIYAQAVAWILIGRFELLHEALAEFEGRAWTVFSILVWGPFVAMFAIAKMVMSG